MSLLHHQIPDVHWTVKKKIQKMAIFVVFFYMKPWFTAPRLASAATNDLDLYNKLQKFRKIDKKVADKCIGTLQRHTWYLTEDLITFSLFDDELPVETRNELAANIYRSRPTAELPITKPSPFRRYPKV